MMRKIGERKVRRDKRIDKDGIDGKFEQWFNGVVLSEFTELTDNESYV